MAPTPVSTKVQARSAVRVSAQAVRAMFDGPGALLELDGASDPPPVDGGDVEDVREKDEIVNEGDVDGRARAQKRPARD